MPAVQLDDGCDVRCAMTLTVEARGPTDITARQHHINLHLNSWHRKMMHGQYIYMNLNVGKNIWTRATKICAYHFSVSIFISDSEWEWGRIKKNCDIVMHPYQKSSIQGFCVYAFVRSENWFTLLLCAPRKSSEYISYHHIQKTWWKDAKIKETVHHKLWENTRNTSPAPKQKSVWTSHESSIVNENVILVILIAWCGPTMP